MYLHIFDCNGKHSKRIEKLGYMKFPSKGKNIYSGEKKRFDNKNNHE